MGRKTNYRIEDCVYIIGNIDIAYILDKDVTVVKLRAVTLRTRLF